jgi:hypothetical protein
MTTAQGRGAGRANLPHRIARVPPPQPRGSSNRTTNNRKKESNANGE